MSSWNRADVVERWGGGERDYKRSRHARISNGSGTIRSRRECSGYLPAQIFRGQRCSQQHVQCSRACAVMFNAMAVADKCMIRIHYLVGGLWGRGDEIPASKRACIYHGDHGCADGSRMTDFTDINQISVISIY